MWTCSLINTRVHIELRREMAASHVLVRGLDGLVCVGVAADVQAMGADHVVVRIFLLNSGMLVELELL